jgi:DNA (cytosine-5)-methyltransferase 3A
MNVLSLFDGMSCGQIALNRAGVKFDNYFASEVDKHAIAVTQYNYPSTVQLGDVTKVSSDNLPQIDLLIGGSPCQGFSFSGNMPNFDDPRSKLFFDFVRLQKECGPKYFLLENVVMKKEFQDVITEQLGLEPVLINSSLVSAQNRKRLYWTNIPNVTVPDDKGILLKDIVEDCIGVWVYPRGYNKGGVQLYKGKAPCVTTSSWQHNFKVAKSDGRVIMFTPEQTEALQTVPTGYTSSVSNNQRYKLLGNGWTVDVITHILKGLS